MCIRDSPPRAPQGNASAEQWVRTLRHEPLDRTITWNERQPHPLLVEYVDHYNNHRPHRRIDQRAPDDDHLVTPIRPGHPIQRHTTCAGLINTSTNPQPEPAHRPTQRPQRTASNTQRPPPSEKTHPNSRSHPADGFSAPLGLHDEAIRPVSYTHLRAHE